MSSDCIGQSGTLLSELGVKLLTVSDNDALDDPNDLDQEEDD